MCVWSFITRVEIEKVEKAKGPKAQDWQAAKYEAKAHTAFLNYGPRVSASMALVGELPLAVNTADNMWDDDSTQSSGYEYTQTKA